MHLSLRSLFLLSSLALLSACSSAGQSAAPAAGAAGSGIQVSQDASGGRLIVRPLGIHPDAKGPSILMDFITNGPAQGGVPCFACVNGASSNDTVGLTGPSSYVYSGQEWQYTIAWTDLTFKGKCKVAWTIAAGKKKIDSFGATITLTSAGGFALWGINRSFPKYSGMATVTGTVTCGKDSGTQSAPIIFQ